MQAMDADLNTLIAAGGVPATGGAFIRSGGVLPIPVAQAGNLPVCVVGAPALVASYHADLGARPQSPREGVRDLRFAPQLHGAVE